MRVKKRLRYKKTHSTASMEEQFNEESIGEPILRYSEADVDYVEAR